MQEKTQGPPPIIKRSGLQCTTSLTPEGSKSWGGARRRWSEQDVHLDTERGAGQSCVPPHPYPFPNTGREWAAFLPLKNSWENVKGDHQTWPLTLFNWFFWGGESIRQDLKAANRSQYWPKWHSQATAFKPKTASQPQWSHRPAYLRGSTAQRQAQGWLAEILPHQAL